ncbi:MAG: nuclear transport factor 2 family protein [Planctomycetes bacterium]|nr:nuclear transport factor 2 family protein [Planctomycetota bacterium]
MTVKLKLLGIMLVLLHSLNLEAQDLTAEQQIQEASKLYEQALTQKNEPLLKSILADNFILTTASGKVLTKKDMMLNLTKEGTKYDKFESSDVRISVSNDAAIETGKVHTVGIRDGKKITETTRYTDFWVKVQGKWLLLAEHSSFINNP